MKQKVRLFGALFISLLTLQSQVSKKKSQEELNNILGGNEAKAVNDQVFADDVIVQSSLCVGMDCVNGENFGFDTERLKENNLRIHFNDTSNSGSFPSSDWRIVANESSNGGDNFLAFEDSDAGTYPFKVQSGSGNNALFVKRGEGNIGFGTNTPVVELHTVDGNSPTLRLEQDASSGFTPQAWDLAGNETNFFVRDVTNGSLLPFRIRPSAPTNSLYKDTDGGIGFRTQTPDGLFDIAHPVDANNHAILLDDTGNFGLNIDNGEAVHGLFDVQTTGGVSNFTVTSTGVYVKNAILPGASLPSDEKLKRNIHSLSDATMVIMQLNPKSYFFKNEVVDKYGFTSEKQFGLIAQEIEKVLPNLVATKDLGKGDYFKTVDYTSFVPILIQGFKEQQGIIESQAQKISKLEKEMQAYSSLEKRIKAIEAHSMGSMNISNAKK